MIRATGGIWVNYATTVVFQVLFARSYGANLDATSFVILFGILIAVGGVLTSSTQAVIVPRLVGRDGELLSGPLGALIAISAVGAVVFGGLVVARDEFATVLAPIVNVPAPALSDPLPAAAAFVFLQVVAAQLTSICLARGQRFLPAVAPALPSIVAVALLIVLKIPSTTDLFIALAVGSALEAGVLAALLKRPIRIAKEHPPRIARIAVLTAVQFALLNTIAPVERVVASSASAASAAQYNYAIRSLAIVLQLLVGGFMLASLGDWSSLVRNDEHGQLRRSLARTSVFSLLLLVLAASIALVAGQQIVALVYQRGAFTAADTNAVTTLLLIALPGFCAEGLVLVFSQALVAARRNGAAIGIGLVNVAVRLGLIFTLGLAWGAKGVAGAYSISAVIVLALELAVVWGASLAGRAEWPAARRGATIALGTIATAGVCAGLSQAVPVVVQLAIVVGVFALLVRAFRPGLPWSQA